MFLDAKVWARDLVADGKFGDVRRNRLVARLLRGIAERPAGRVTDVFKDGAAQQAAFDFLEGHSDPDALIESFASATLRSAEAAGHCFVVVDGTSLSLTDRHGRK